MHSSAFHIIIPVRFASTRLPGKALCDIAGKPLIQRVYEKAMLCGAETVTIATDDERIQAVAQSFNAPVCMTALSHTNGTERLAEAVEQLGFSEENIVVNLQGDEPLVPVEAVLKLVEAIVSNPNANVSTLCTPIFKCSEVTDPNVVKVVKNHAGFALYFTRAAVPYNRDNNTVELSDFYFRHLGLYAYRVNTLKQYSHWEPSPLEDLEKLEQLRILWHGGRIHVTCINERLPPGVDTEADRQEVSRHYSGGGGK